jgi:hypothetical protein
VSIDRLTGVVEISPLRGTAFNANVTQFLHPPFSPVNQMTVDILPSSDLPNGCVEADVTFNHPFPGLDQYREFDVRGIFMADGSHVSDHDPAIYYGDKDLNEAVVLNPDGYTRWWNATEFMDSMPLFSFKPGKLGNNPMPTATLNPYKYYADDLPYDGIVGDLDPATRGVFSPGGPTHTRLYKIQFPVDSGTPSFKFNCAVDASWYKPDHAFAPEYPIESFSPSAQCQEAYNLSLNTGGSSLWYESGDFGGKLAIKLEVFDWQAPVNPLGVQGEVKAVWIESPVLDGPVDMLPFSTSSPGSQATSSIFETELDKSMLNIASPGDFPILVAVESTVPNSYQPQVDGGEMFIFPTGPLAAYAFGSVHVEGEQQYAPAEDVTGNVKLSVARNSSKSIAGITLDWTENTNISPYYAVYADDNPYNGLNPVTLVEEFTDSVVTVDIGNWPDLSTTGAYAFGVKGRSVSGLAYSESPDMSELAFVELEDFDGGESPIAWVEGYGDAQYQWEEANPGSIDGSTSLKNNPACPINQWGVTAGAEIPGIPQSEMSFMEFVHLGSNYSSWSLCKSFSAGFTHSIPPTGTPTYPGYDSTDDFYCIMDGTWNWALPNGPPPSGGWAALFERFEWNPPGYTTFFGWRYPDCPQGTPALTRMAFPQFRNDAGTIRPALAWATSQYNDYQDWFEVDEVAVVIY